MGAFQKMIRLEPKLIYFDSALMNGQYPLEAYFHCVPGLPHPTSSCLTKVDIKRQASIYPQGHKLSLDKRCEIRRSVTRILIT